MNATPNEWKAGILALGVLVFGMWLRGQGYDATAYGVFKEAVQEIAAAATIK